MPINTNQIAEDPRLVSAQTAAPSTGSGTGSYFPLDVGAGQTEAAFADESGNITQLTDRGSLNIQATNLGVGQQVLAGIVGNTFQFRTLVAGTNVTLSSDANSITINSTASGGASSLNDLSDVSTVGALSGQALVFNGSSWAPMTISTGGTPLVVQDEGSSVDSDVSQMNFTGSGVTVSQTSSGQVEVNIPGGSISAINELIIQLGAGASIADKVAAAPSAGIPAGVQIVDGTNGLVDSELAGAVDDLVIIHGQGRVAIAVEAVNEGPVFAPTFSQSLPSASGAAFNPGTMQTSSNGNQTRITGWNTSVGSNNQRTWTVIRLVPILS